MTSPPADRYHLTAAQARTLAPLLTGRHARGPSDAIVDVPGVQVGHCTVQDGERIRTGVTAVRFDQLGQRRLPANLAVGNGHGKLVGATQIVELGEIETPILLTATLSTFRVADALVTWVLQQPEHADTTSLNPVVAECNDAELSDIRARPITDAHVFAALDSASTDRPAEGAVGAGTGMLTMGFKGGIGTASRLCELSGQQHTVGLLALTNFAGRLPVSGIPEVETVVPQGNSCVLIAATDAPVDARQLGRVARRCIFAMGAAGADFTHGSGDYAIAVSVAEPDSGHTSPDDRSLTPLFTATAEATKAAIVHSMLAADGVVTRAGKPIGGLRETWCPA